VPTPVGTTVEAGLGTARGASVAQVLLGPVAVPVARYGAGIITARSFGARKGETVIANSELTGFAAANIASGRPGGFPSPLRTRAQP